MDAAEPKPAPPAELPPPGDTPFKLSRPQGALIALGLYELGSAIGLWLSLRERDSFGIAAAVLLGAAAFLPSAGLWLNKAWAAPAGFYIGWAGIVIVIIRGLSRQFSAPWDFIAGGAYAVVLMALNSTRPTRPEGPQDRRPDSFGLWLKENAEAIVIAFIMALVIRCFCIEVFKIPSSSMEPTLLGDITNKHDKGTCTFNDYHVSPGGDRIMVTKYYYAFSPIERYDVVVFKFPLNQAKNFIKRVVGLPNEELLVHKGNLFVKKKGDAEFRIAGRTLRTQDSLWIVPTGYSHFFKDPDAFYRGTYWKRMAPAGSATYAQATIQGDELSTQDNGGQRGITFQLDGLTSGAGNQRVGDVRIAFEVELTSPKGQVFAEIRNEHGLFELRLDTDAPSELRWHAPGTEEKGQPSNVDHLKDVRFEMDRKYKVDLSVFDGWAYARVNGDVVAKLQCFELLKTVQEFKTASDPIHSLSFGSRGATFKARNLAVGRDIYYEGRRLLEDAPLEIKDGKYVMMGDNVTNSHDSRAWIKCEFILNDGRRVVCEEQELNRDNIRARLKEKFALEDEPDYGIEADQDGNPRYLFRKDIKEELAQEPFPFIDRKFIVGKALWIWWPKGRWFHLIR